MDHRSGRWRRKGRESGEKSTAHGPQRKNKKRRFAVDSQHLLLPKEGTSLQQVRAGQEKLSRRFWSSLLPAAFPAGRGELPTGHCCEQRGTRVHWKTPLAQQGLAFPAAELCASTATTVPAGRHRTGWSNFSTDTARSGSLPLPVEPRAPCQNGTARVRVHASPAPRH